MNERLEKEIKKYFDNPPHGYLYADEEMRLFLEETVQHFYNLALEDVKKEAKIISMDGRSLSVDRLIDFIEKQKA